MNVKGDPLSPEVTDFILKNYKNRGNFELTNMINEEFGTSYPKSKIKCYKGNHGLNSGLTGRFESGRTAPNKGKKITDFVSEEGMKAIRKTWFNKGHTPANARPLGLEQLRADGYWWVKVGANKWRQKHRVLWEDYHDEKVPKGENIIFLDGDINNFDKANLVKITMEESLLLNRYHLRFDDKDLTHAGVSIAKLMAKTNEKRKELNGKQD